MIELIVDLKIEGRNGQISLPKYAAIANKKILKMLDGL